MAIQTEMINDRIRHYSDKDLKILQVETGIDKYDDAVDEVPCPYHYEETDKPIEHLDEDANNEEDVV